MTRAAVLLLGLLCLSCGPETRYPLVFDRGHLFLEGRDRTGLPVRVLVDTGSDGSFLDEAWVRKVGGEVVAWAPATAEGVGVSAASLARARHVPRPEGLPDWFDGLMVHGPGNRGFFDLLRDDLHPVVGLAGLDLLQGWVLDFRGDRPWLTRTPDPTAAGPGRARFDLYPYGTLWALPVTLQTEEWGNGGAILARQALIDTGADTAAAWFHPPDQPWPGETANRQSTMGVNGFPLGYFTPARFSPGDRPVSGLVVCSVAWNRPETALSLGSPFLFRYRAVVDLGARSLSFDRRPRSGPVTYGEAWAWDGHVVPGRGFRIDRVLDGSGPDRRGVHSGALVSRIGDLRVDRPLSVLEQRRAWVAFALTPP